ncbi:hypothetical protein DYB28_013024 [Aphanomyces astaci]|uniref:Endonuclease/exonuclease/phosphatase domain-containing protein n=2 Tax=Aphanomyces astaci TaxID=112090 RepID=A0A397DU57_APHAT|nr:hypothetical protein DYB30_001966 [Aphanomyces astaci]RLO03313.1 hypothetical protein DYB28_013024 [Aphanomyces astaci]
MKFSIEDLVDLVSDEDDDMEFKAAIAASALEHMHATGTAYNATRNVDATVSNSSADNSSSEMQPPTTSNSFLHDLHAERMQRQQLRQGPPSAITSPLEEAVTMAAPQSPTTLLVASLNVWFDEVLVEERINAMCNLFSTLAPHVIFLQEVTPDMGALLSSTLRTLGYAAANAVTDQAYSELILVKGLPILQYTRHPFERSAMGRHLHVVETEFNGKPLRLATAHLESLAQNRTTRLAQLKWSFSHLLDNSTNQSWVFGGDMNLGSKDVVAVPASVEDAWVASGRPADHQHTWDTTINKNLPNVHFAAKCRFDRLYSHGLRCDGFATFGKEPLSNHSNMYPSDHWGVVASYSSSHNPHQ